MIIHPCNLLVFPGYLLQYRFRRFLASPDIKECLPGSSQSRICSFLFIHIVHVNIRLVFRIQTRHEIIGCLQNHICLFLFEQTSPQSDLVSLMISLAFHGFRSHDNVVRFVSFPLVFVKGGMNAEIFLKIRCI